MVIFLVSIYILVACDSKVMCVDIFCIYSRAYKINGTWYGYECKFYGGCIFWNVGNDDNETFAGCVWFNRGNDNSRLCILDNAVAIKESFRHNQRKINTARLGGLFYRRITVCITVFGVLGSWGGFGLELHAQSKIKTIRPARLRHPTQKPTKQRKSNEKTHRMVRF